MRPLLIAVLAATVMTPALAQRQPTPEQRIERLERQLRQVQRRVFPRGQPVDTAGFVDDPAATQGAVNALTLRLDSIERQMTELLRTSEENGNRLGVIEADLARLRADQDRRFRSLESSGAAASGSPPASDPPSAAPSAAVPPPPQPKFENAGSRPALPAPSTTSADPAEQAYDRGYQLWLAKRYPEAITALRAMASSFPGHRRVSWAHNLVGRALLDSGQPRAAAEALLANYRRDPHGERAPDSLFYLGQALIQLKQPGQACKAYDELRDVYGATMRADLRKLLPAARAQAGCR